MLSSQGTHIRKLHFFMDRDFRVLLGCCGDCKGDWEKGRPRKWLHMLRAIIDFLDFHKPDGLVNGEHTTMFLATNSLAPLSRFFLVTAHFFYCKRCVK